MQHLTKESFTEKQLAEQKGGLYKYYEYKEGNRNIVIRIYSVALAVDYYVGIDLEDSESVRDFTNEDEAWEKALEVANRFFTTYEFKGQQAE